MDNICYRCGMRIGDSRICPACGFDIQSPVEITFTKRTISISVYRKDTGETVWEGRVSDQETVRIDAPSPVPVRIVWAGIPFDRMMVNGEAYRFMPSKVANSCRLIKTRRIPKRHRRNTQKPE